MSAKSINSNREAVMLLHALLNSKGESLTAEDYRRMARTAERHGYWQVAREMYDCADEIDLDKVIVLV